MHLKRLTKSIPVVDGRRGEEHDGGEYGQHQARIHDHKVVEYRVPPDDQGEVKRWVGLRTTVI